MEGRLLILLVSFLLSLSFGGAAVSKTTTTAFDEIAEVNSRYGMESLNSFHD